MVRRLPYVRKDRDGRRTGLFSSSEEVQLPSLAPSPAVGGRRARVSFEGAATDDRRPPEYNRDHHGPRTLKPWRVRAYGSSAALNSTEGYDGDANLLLPPESSGGSHKLKRKVMALEAVAHMSDALRHDDDSRGRSLSIEQRHALLHEQRRLLREQSYCPVAGRRHKLSYAHRYDAEMRDMVVQQQCPGLARTVDAPEKPNPAPKTTPKTMMGTLLVGHSTSPRGSAQWEAQGSLVRGDSGQVPAANVSKPTITHEHITRLAEPDISEQQLLTLHRSTVEDVMSGSHCKLDKAICPRVFYTRRRIREVQETLCDAHCLTPEVQQSLAMAGGVGTLPPLRDGATPASRRWLTREQLAMVFGHDDADLVATSLPSTIGGQPVGQPQLPTCGRVLGSKADRTRLFDRQRRRRMAESLRRERADTDAADIEHHASEMATHGLYSVVVDQSAPPVQRTGSTEADDKHNQTNNIVNNAPEKPHAEVQDLITEGESAADIDIETPAPVDASGSAALDATVEDNNPVADVLPADEALPLPSLFPVV